MKVENLKLVNGLVVFTTSEDSYTKSMYSFYKALYSGVFTLDLIDFSQIYDVDQFIEVLTQALTIKTVYIKASQYLTVKTIRTACEAIGLDFNVIELPCKSKFKNNYQFTIEGKVLNNASDAMQYIKSLGYRVITRDGQWQKEY
jgi:hypothetical protein